MADGNGFCLVAERADGEVLGFVFCVEREGLSAYVSRPAIGYVEEIGVIEMRAEAWRRPRADGRRARARSATRGYSHFELSTVPGNDEARACVLMLGESTASRGLLMFAEEALLVIGS